jgi:ADP-heptose:LPS heptosyltransferase
VVAFAGDRPQWKNHAADALMPWSATPANLADMFASLAGAGDETFEPSIWTPPPFKPFNLPQAPYAVLHVGAGSVLRHWPQERWTTLAERIAAQGVTPIWSAGPGEVALVDRIDPQHRYPSLAGQLDLAQLWHLLAGARLLVAPDTGIAHLAKLTNTPTVCLFGPGSDTLFGVSRFWREHRFAAAIVPDFPCRDQNTLFRREITWVRRCQRGLDRCPAPACMYALDIDAVAAACAKLLQ